MFTHFTGMFTHLLVCLHILQVCSHIFIRYIFTYLYVFKNIIFFHFVFSDKMDKIDIKFDLYNKM